MRNKILWALLLPCLVLPQAVLASVSGGVGASGDGWSFSIGFGNGGTGGAYGLPGGSIFDIVENILFWLLAIISIVAIIGFIIAGILYLTAAGDETQAGRAKKALTYSIIGVIVGLSGFVMLQAAFYMLTGTSRF